VPARTAFAAGANSAPPTAAAGVAFAVETNNSRLFLAIILRKMRFVPRTPMHGEESILPWHDSLKIAVERGTGRAAAHASRLRGVNTPVGGLRRLVAARFVSVKARQVNLVPISVVMFVLFVAAG
jgi:hypothetical protein